MRRIRNRFCTQQRGTRSRNREFVVERMRVGVGVRVGLGSGVRAGVGAGDYLMLDFRYWPYGFPAGDIGP